LAADARGEALFFDLGLGDITAAADLFHRSMPLEVSPALAYDAARMQAAERSWDDLLARIADKSDGLARRHRPGANGVAAPVEARA
jgi:hypothetical protein